MTRKKASSACASGALIRLSSPIRNTRRWSRSAPGNSPSRPWRRRNKAGFLKPKVFLVFLPPLLPRVELSLSLFFPRGRVDPRGVFYVQHPFEELSGQVAYRLVAVEMGLGQGVNHCLGGGFL